MVAARAEHADVRTRILDEATRLLAARGFDGTTVQDIADAVGVTKPAVLHHFPSKELVREAVLGALLAHWEREAPSPPARRDGQRRSLRGRLRRASPFLRFGSEPRPRRLARGPRPPRRDEEAPPRRRAPVARR